MNTNNNFNLQIDHSNKKFKILKLVILKTKDNQLYEASKKDFNVFEIMMSNFLDNCYKNNVNFTFFFDLNYLKNVPVLLILDIFNLFKEKFHVIKKNLIGSVIVTNENTFKGMFDLFMKFYKPSKPLKLCKDFDEANIFFNECSENKYKDSEIIY